MNRQAAPVSKRESGERERGGKGERKTLISTLAICRIGTGENVLTGQIGVELLHVYLGNRDM